MSVDLFRDLPALDEHLQALAESSRGRMARVVSADGYMVTVEVPRKGGWDGPLGPYPATVTGLVSGETGVLVPLRGNGALFAAVGASSGLVLDASHPRWGIAWDGVTDDTLALQAFIDAVQVSHATGLLPPRTALISSPLTFSRTWGWAFRGSGRDQTVIRMATDNQPILILGSDTASFAHSWSLGGFTLTYSNVQPETNTNANCIALADMIFQGTFDDILFGRGRYGIKLLDPAKNSPWGCVFDRLWFGDELTGGCIDAVGAAAGPNNRYGHVYVRADNMTQPLFSLEGANAVMENLEVNSLLQGPVVMRWNAGSVGTIHAFKVEGAAWTTNQPIIEFGVNCKFTIGTVMLYGSTFTVPSGIKVNLFNLGTGGGGGGDTSLDVGAIDIAATGIAGTVYGFSGTLAAMRGGARCGAFRTADSNIRLQDNGSTAIADALMVHDRTNHRMSGDRGDANYTVSLTDPNIISYQTAFTAQRTLTLPSDGNNMHGGLYYKVVIGSGVVNGANTLVIKAGATTLYTESSDKRVITFTWRRHTTAASGWVMTGYETLP